jgi:hypothetical protein
LTIAMPFRRAADALLKTAQLVEQSRRQLVIEREAGLILFIA